MNTLDRYLTALGQGMDIIAAARGLSERDLVQRGASDIAAREVVHLCDVYFGRCALVKSGGVVYLSFLNRWIGGQCQGRCWGPSRG